MLSAICTARIDLPILVSANRIHSSFSNQKLPNRAFGGGLPSSWFIHSLAFLVRSRPASGPLGHTLLNCPALVLRLVNSATCLRIFSISGGRVLVIIGLIFKFNYTGWDKW